MTDADFSGADLDGADLVHANFYEANLKGAKLVNANARFANLWKSTFNASILKKKDCEHIKKQGAKLNSLTICQ